MTNTDITIRKFPINTQPIPEEMRRESRWITWRAEETPQKRLTKRPYNPLTIRWASTTDPTTWSTYEVAVKAVSEYDGIGFVLGGGYVGFEIDDCRDPQTGEIAEQALEYIIRLDSYTEVSPSGRGIHIIAKQDGSLRGGTSVKSPGETMTDIGLYCDGRYFTVTGHVLPGFQTLLNERTETFKEIFQELSRRSNAVALDPTATEGDPPVQLRGQDLKIWRGESFEPKTDGSVDRSKSLCLIARVLRNSGATPGQIEHALRERDESLGWRKYIDRKDKGESDYRYIMDMVFRQEAAVAPVHEAEDGDLYTFDFSDGVRIRIEQIRESWRDGGLQAEVTITQNGRQVHWARLVLASTSGRHDIVKELAGKDKVKEHYWTEILTTVCHRTVQRFRTPKTPIEARPQALAGSQHLVYPMLPDKSITILFGDGGVGKGWVALALAVGIGQMQTLDIIPGLTFRRHGKVLYVDAEDHLGTFEDRLLAVYNGLDLDESVRSNILHYTLARGLMEEIEAIKRLVEQENIILVILDSYAMAVGIEPESSEAATRSMKTLRGLGVAVLVVAHISKAAAENTNAYRPFGSIILPNSSRSSWEIQREGVEDHLITLSHRKTNVGKFHKPLTYRLNFVNRLTEHGEERLVAMSVEPRDYPLDIEKGNAILEFLTKCQDHTASTTEIGVFLRSRFPNTEHNPRRIMAALEGANRVLRVMGRGAQAWKLSGDITKGFYVSGL